MGENDIHLDRLCQVYEKLDDEEKGKVIKLAEGLLISQRIMTDEKNDSKEKTKNIK